MGSIGILVKSTVLCTFFRLSFLLSEIFSNHGMSPNKQYSFNVTPGGEGLGSPRTISQKTSHHPVPIKESRLPSIPFDLHLFSPNGRRNNQMFISKEAKGRFMSLVLILNLAVRIHVDIFANFDGDLEVWLLLHAVAAYRACQATDPRDKIYTLLGLLEIRRQEDVLAFTPNYDISVQDLYKKFAYYFISKGKVHHILEKCGRQYQIRGLPSWTPGRSFGEIISPISAFDVGLEPNHKFRASGDLSQSFIFSPSSNILLIEGIRISRIKSTTSIVPPQQTTLASMILVMLESLLLVLDQNIGERPDDPTSWIQSIEALEESCADDLKQLYLLEGTKTDALRRAFPASLNDHFTVENNDQVLIIDQIQSPRNEQESILRMTIALQGRRFCVSSDGNFGIVPKETQEHDWICVLLGIPVPFIVREHENCYSVIDDCNVQGMMEVEAVKKVEGLLEVRTLSLVW